MLVAAFEVEVGGPALIGPFAAFQREHMGATAVEPHVEDVADHFVIIGIAPLTQKKGCVFLRPGIDPSGSNRVDDALGGRAYYLARAELEIPLGSGAKDLGLRPSIFADVGALWGVSNANALGPTFPYTLICNGTASSGFATAEGLIPTLPATCTGAGDLVTPGQPFQESFLGDSPRPRVSVGVGVNWNSPFGPLRIDFAKVLLKSPGDATKTFTFNVGTQF